MALNAESKDFTRRAFVIGGFKLSLFSVLIGRLYYLQVMKSEEFELMSENNRIRIIPIFPKRGIIYDKNDKIIATNKRNFELLINTRNEQELMKTLDGLESILGLGRVDIDEILYNINQTKKQRSFYIIKDLSWNEVVDLEFHKSRLPASTVIETNIRYYNFPESFCHIIGYVSKFDKKLASPTTKNNLREFRIGLTGLEKRYDSELSGDMGFDNVEVNSKGRVIRKISRKSPTIGQDLKLTIDVDLQEYLNGLLKGQGGKFREGGSACLLDIETGDVLALASLPNYNANLFVKGIDKNAYELLEKDPDAPFRDKTIRGLYSPGSTFKLVTALAGLELGIINEFTEFYCPGYYDLAKKRYHCWYKQGHASMNVVRAIAQSCNVFFYELAIRIGVDKLAEYSRKLGLGTMTGIELENEQSGLVPDQEWKKKIYNKPWYAGETLSVGIGQSYTLTTPVQLAVMVAKIASGNLAIKPTLIKKEPIDPDNEPIEIDKNKLQETEISKVIEKIKANDSSFNKDALDIVRKGMARAVAHPSGTLHYYNPNDKKYLFAGKTGTVQVVSKKTFEEFGDKKETRNHSLFIGFAPAEEPKYAVSVVIEHGGMGSGLAGSIGNRILQKTMKKYENILPASPAVLPVDNNIPATNKVIEEEQKITIPKNQPED